VYVFLRLLAVETAHHVCMSHHELDHGMPDHESQVVWRIP